MHDCAILNFNSGIPQLCKHNIIILSYRLYQTCISGRVKGKFLFCTDSNDFVELDNLTLTIPSSTPVGTSTCQSVTILGDDTLESNELFTVTLYPVNPRDSITGSNTSTVTILDDGDGTLL